MRRRPFLAFAAVTALLLALPDPGLARREDRPAAEASDDDGSKLVAGTFRGLAFRSIGPAFTSGRIADLAVVPDDPRTIYVAAAAGGVWKSVDGGITWKPIFDDQGSSSIGVVTVDPARPSTVWVGTGENNSQRSVGYGDGVYKSTDGGATWKNMGLGESEHIGTIAIDPRDSDVVYVAAHGPLWSSGGDRGLYKTTDGGATWTRVLEISEDTGVNEVRLDPRDPDTLWASAYQRRRRVWTLLHGGPESGLWKSTDAGATWREVERGLPTTHLGRIGLAVALSEPGLLYAIVEAAGGPDGENPGGTFRSTDGGESWEKRSSYVSGSPQYYQEIFVDPHDPERLYSMDTLLQTSDDGGKTWRAMNTSGKHVDDHALWIDPEDTDHLLVGNDGGLYETFNRGTTWRFTPNLPITQFYKVEVDRSRPFYFVYGGTQDNFTLGGPNQTVSQHGILPGEWFVTSSGDGFQPRVDPTDPDTVYSQSQYGNLVRYDRRSGEMTDIQPQPEPGEDPPRWNWDSPLVISPHSPTRLYFASQRIFRSDDRGDSWRPVSGDLTRRLDRNTLAVMGRVWGPDAVAKNASTSPYGNVVSLAESPRVEDLLYAGTDDGLVQISEDGGATWRSVASESLPGVPRLAYVRDLEPSHHHDDTVYVAVDDHKSGDFTPYLLRSRDRGRTWTGIGSGLPERGSVYAVVEDPVDPDLLFVGTETGVHFTADGGATWTRLAGGLPTVAVRDLAIHPAENDLVAATFGRGFYVLDDYAPLRGIDEAALAREATLFAPPEAWLYAQSTPLGFRDKSFQGDTLWTGENPPFGALFTYYLADAYETLRAERLEREAEAWEAGDDLAYPPWEELRREAREEEPAVTLVVRDDADRVIRRLDGPAGAGFHRVAWDLRYPPPDPVALDRRPPTVPWASPPMGPFAGPGTYSVELVLRHRDEERPLGERRSFEVTPLGLLELPPAERAAAAEFHRRVAGLQRASLGAGEALAEARDRVAHLRRALDDTPGVDPALRQRARDLARRLDDLDTALHGDRVIASHNEPTPPAATDRVSRIAGSWDSTGAPTATQRRGYEIAAAELAPLLADLARLVAGELAELEAAAEAAGAPWTPGRVPRWQADGE